MTGSAAVMKRIRVPAVAKALLVIAAFGALVDTFNVFTALHDAAEHGQRLRLWEPATWESTSFIAMLLSCGTIYAAIRTAPPATTPWPKFIAVHALGTLVFSSLHILLVNALRVAIYTRLGHHYEFGESGFFYEYRKDVVGYIIIGTIFWLFLKEPQALAVMTSGPQTIDIRDGKRLLRVPTETIAAIRAAGNYVEFILLDDRRPLARQSLSTVHRELGERGFVRTHRSWLVNLHHVRGLVALRAGDFEIELDGGIKAPLSRRFPEALDRLRKPAHPG